MCRQKDTNDTKFGIMASYRIIDIGKKDYWNGGSASCQIIGSSIETVDWSYLINNLQENIHNLIYLEIGHEQYFCITF